MNNKRLLIVGAGSFGRTIQEAALMSGVWTDCAFLDDSWPMPSRYSGYNIISPVREHPQVISEFDGLAVAIGDNEVRKGFLNTFFDLDYPTITLIHPRAFVSKSAVVGRGSLLMAGAVVGAHATVGLGCILNPNSVADHDCVMDNYSQLGVGCVMAGTAALEEGAWMRAGSGISYGAVVPAWTILEP